MKPSLELNKFYRNRFGDKVLVTGYRPRLSLEGPPYIKMELFDGFMLTDRGVARIGRMCCSWDRQGNWYGGVKIPGRKKHYLDIVSEWREPFFNRAADCIKGHVSKFLLKLAKIITDIAWRIK